MRPHARSSRAARWLGALCAVYGAATFAGEPVPLGGLQHLPVSDLATSAGPSDGSMPDTAAAEGIGQALDLDALEHYRGGTDTVENNVDIDGAVSHNTAQDIVTGTNVIDGGAFANSTGISTVIQNSGANVLIQNGTVVNVQFVDPGSP